MVDYVVAPIEETLTNNGTLDFYSEDRVGSDISAGQERLGRGNTRLPDLVLHGVVSQLHTSVEGTKTNAFVFRIRVTDTVNNTLIFSGSKQIAKEGSRGDVGF